MKNYEIQGILGKKLKNLKIISIIFISKILIFEHAYTIDSFKFGCEQYLSVNCFKNCIDFKIYFVRIPIFI